MVGEKGAAQRLGSWSRVLRVGRWAVAKDSGRRGKSVFERGKAAMELSTMIGFKGNIGFAINTLPKHQKHRVSNILPLDGPTDGSRRALGTGLSSR